MIQMNKMRNKLLQKLWLPVIVICHLLYAFVYWWMGQDLSVTTKVKVTITCIRRR